MEDELLQALKDFVATSNSGKYKTEEELLSKFPELQDYDTNVLKDFVATSNSGKYKTEQELMSKFPEFSTPVKKKESSTPGIATRTASELGLETQEPTPQNGSLDGSEVDAVPEKTEETIKQQARERLDKAPKGDVNIDIDYSEARLNQLQENLTERDTTFTNILEFEKATSLSPEELEEAQQNVDKRLQGDFLEKANKKLADFTNRVTAFHPLEAFRTNIKQETYKEEKTKKAISLLEEQKKEATPDNINAAVQEISLKEETAGLKERKVIDYVKSLTDNQREQLNINQVYKYKTVEIGVKAKVLELEIDGEKIKRAVGNLKGYEDVISKMKADGKEIPPSLAAQYLERFDSTNALIEVNKEKYQNYIAELDKNEDKKIETYEAIDLIKRNYKFLDNMKAQVAMSTGDLFVAGTKGFLAYTLNAAAGITGSDLVQETSDSMVTSSQKTKDLTQKVAGEFRPRMEYNDITNLTDIGYFMAQETATQIPILATIMNPVSSTAGIVALGASSAGNKLTDMKIEERGINPKNYSLLQELAVPFSYGAAEAVLGTLPTSRILRRTISAPAQRMLLNKGSLGYTKQFLTDNGLEVITEDATTLSQNILDRYALDKKEVKLSDNIAKTTFSTLASSPLITGGTKIVSEIVKPFIPKSQLEELQKGYSKVLKLQEAYNNSDSQAVRNILESKITEANKLNELLVNRVRTNVSSLSDKDYAEVNEITRRQALLQSEAQIINKDKSLSKDQKKEILKDLSSEFNTLEEKRNQTLENKTNKTGNETSDDFLDLIPEEELQTLKDKAQRELMSEKEAEGVKDYKITEEEITERAIQIFESTDTKTKTNENQEENNQENSTQEEIVQQDEQEEVLEDDLGQQNTLAESVDEDAIYVKDGKRGKLVRQGDVISFETENEVIDIENNVENLDKPLSEFGINLENEVEVSIDENNNVTVNGQTYINNYSDPNSAISQNEKGEYTVSLETNKGEKRTFRGRRADQIVYQTKLKEYYDKSTPEQQAEAEKLADEAIVSRENKQAADKGKNKNPRQSEQEYLDSAKAERKAKLAKAESTPKPTISQQTQQFADEVSDTQEDLSEVSAGALQVTVGDSNIILNDKGDNIVIESVNTPKGKRGKGNARKALQKAVEVADKQNKTLELDVKPLGNTTTKKGLTSLYESLGFKADPNQKGKMIRNPNQKTPTKKDEAKTPTKKETKPKVAKAASKPKKTKPTLKPNQVKRIKTKGVKGEFDVEIDIDGYVVKITSVKDGREVSKFTKPSKVKGKKTKPRLNANYSRIEKEALGQKTPNQIKQEQNKKINDAVTSFIPTNEYQAALEYVALGGNISLASAKEMTGYSAKEVRWITGFKPDSELIKLEQVAEDIVADQEKEGVAEYEESKVISGLQDILQENTSVTQVREKVLEIQSKIDEVNAGGQSINEQQIAAFINNLTPQEFAQFEAIKAEDEFLSELSDKEAIEYYNEQAKNYEKGNEATIQGQENEGKPTTDNKGDEVIGQNDDGQQIKEQSDDEILNFLNEAAKKLGDFGKQNIGINLPVVIAQGVVQTVRVAYKAGKSGAIVIREAIEYIKSTDWYKSLSKKEQKKIGSSTVMEAFNQTESTDKESFQDLEQSFKNQDEKIKNKESFKKKKQRAERLLIQKITDRQFIAKKLVDEAGAQETKDAMVSNHGSSGRAKRIYEKAYQDIYTDKISFKENGKIKIRYQPINSQDRSFLDKMIVLKRIIAIDKNREEKNLPAIKHPGDTNGVAAQKYLNHLKEKIGKKRYKELEVRTKTYFDVFKKVLFEMKENGLISEKAYDSMNGLNYQPRLFLQHVTDFEGNVSLGAASNQNSDKGGLSGNQIKEIKEGSTDAIIRDSQWLLATTIASREKAMAMNTVNSIFMTKEFPAAQKRFKNLKANIKNKKNWSKEDKRFYEYFSELNKKVIDNPIISEQKNSKQLVIEGMEPEITYKRKFSEVPANFDKAFYYVNGVKQEFFLEKKLHESWFDNVTGFLNPQTKEIFGLASGSYLLKAIATGINASFSIVNTPRDFAFMTVFSDQYSSVHLVASIQVASDTFKAINAIRKSTGNISRDGNSLEKYIYYGGDMAWLSTQGMLKKESMLGQGLQNMFSGRGGERTKNIAKKIFNSATLKSINTYSELMFRVALFERTVYNELKKLGYKDINEVNDLLDESTGEVIETKKQRTDALYRRGVAEARSLLDFNQGGAITKDLEAFIPYINTAVQGTRVGADATKKNPVKVISKILQSSAAVGAIAIGYSLLKFRLNKDEDEERNSAEIYLDAYEGVSQYQKQQYSIVFDGTKDEEGNYNYTKIAKNQQLAPFLNLFDNVYQQYLRKMVGRKAKDSKVIYNEAWTTIQNNIIPIDITSPITGNLTKNPAAKAALTYTTGYDFYRDQPLTFDQNLDNNVMAGAKDSNIEDFYKKFAREFRLTPANLKGSVESLITTPNTNYLVGVLYGGLDASVAEDKDMDKIAKDMYKDVKSSVQGRYKGKTSNFNKIVNNQRPIEAELKEIKTKNDYREVDVEKVAKDFFNDKLSVPDFLDKMKDYSPKEYKKVESKIKSMAKYGNLDRFVIGLAFETDKEARALKMVQYYGDLFDDENLESVKQMEDLGVLDKETLTEYQKLKDKLSSK